MLTRSKCVHRLVAIDRLERAKTPGALERAMESLRGRVAHEDEEVVLDHYLAREAEIRAEDPWNGDDIPY